MKLSEPLLAKLSKKYEPSAIVKMSHKGKDLLVKTDEDGNQIVMFIGRYVKDRRIKGERYVRRIIRDSKGLLIKDH